jgi:hypothetical protein
VTGRWFSPGPPVSLTNKTDRHDIAEILLKVALNTELSYDYGHDKIIVVPKSNDKHVNTALFGLFESCQIIWYLLSTTGTLDQFNPDIFEGIRIR